MLQLQNAGHTPKATAFDVLTSRGGFAGIIVENSSTGAARVYFNMSCTKGSARAFPSAHAALTYIHDRRTKKNWTV